MAAHSGGGLCHHSKVSWSWMGSFILWLTPRDFWKVLCSGAMSFPSVWRVKGLLLTVKEEQMGTGGTLAT